jgi:hypothetical protein
MYIDNMSRSNEQVHIQWRTYILSSLNYYVGPVVAWCNGLNVIIVTLLSKLRCHNASTTSFGYKSPSFRVVYCSCITIKRWL